MSELKSRADLFEAAAKMMRMCEEAMVPYASKLCGEVSNGWTFAGNPEDYEFPLAIVEGKPVFEGDELYHENFGKVTIRGESGTFLKITIDGIEQKGSAYNPKTFSWLPPKPRTVMVELLREDAEAYVRAYGDCAGVVHKSIAGRIAKALETK